MPLAARPRKPPPSAVIYGTVFTPDARLVHGARVTVQALHSRKHWQAQSDDAGEFYVRVPAGAEDYRVSAEAQGLSPASSIVHVRATERATIFLKLGPGRQR